MGYRSDLEDAQADIDRVTAEGESLRKRLAVDLASFAGAYNVGAHDALSYLADAVQSIVDAANEDAEGRKQEACNALESIEWAEERLTARMVQ